MHTTAPIPARSARVRATCALVLAVSCVLSFVLLSGVALAAAGIVSVVATVLTLGYAVGASKSTGHTPAQASPARS